MFFAAGIVEAVFARYGLDVVMTSAADASHNSGSLHSQGKAFDLRWDVADPVAVAALIQAARSDPFWAVRASAVEALSQPADVERIAFFRQAALDPNSKVRVAALRALGAYRSRDLLPFFLERFQQDDSYLAQAEALRAIGACGTKDQLDVLKNAAATPSPRHVLQDAAEWAITQIDSAKGIGQ